MANEIPKGTAGFKLIFDYGVDLSAATTTTIRYWKPNSSTLNTWTATISGNTIEYTVLTTNFDTEGVWSYQSYVVTPTFTQASTVQNITVTDLLE
jgi:hypothetical protein